MTQNKETSLYLVTLNPHRGESIECLARLTKEEYEFASSHLDEDVECGGCSQMGCFLCAGGSTSIDDIAPFDPDTEVNEDMAARMIEKLREKHEYDSYTDTETDTETEKEGAD